MDNCLVVFLCERPTLALLPAPMVSHFVLDGRQYVERAAEWYSGVYSWLLDRDEHLVGVRINELPTTDVQLASWIRTLTYVSLSEASRRWDTLLDTTKPPDETLTIPAEFGDSFFYDADSQSFAMSFHTNALALHDISRLRDERICPVVPSSRVVVPRAQKS